MDSGREAFPNDIDALKAALIAEAARAAHAEAELAVARAKASDDQALIAHQQLRIEKLTSTIFEGHFPGFPLMPGVLLLESMAQTSGWLIIGITGFTRMPFLAAFNQAKLRSFVKPGDTLELTAALAHEGSGFARTTAEIRNGGKLACNAEITFRVVEFPNPKFR